MREEARLRDLVRGNPVVTIERNDLQLRIKPNPTMSENKTTDDGAQFASAQQEIDDLLQAIGPTGESAEFKKDVQMLVKHGVFFRWPAEGDFEWVHPDDRDLIQSMIPGSRIFCRDLCEDAADQEAVPQRAEKAVTFLARGPKAKARKILNQDKFIRDINAAFDCSVRVYDFDTFSFDQQIEIVQSTEYGHFI